ncbi:phage major tail tube protein, partial [Aeromonas jandaei]
MGLDDGALDTEFTFGGYEAALFKKQHQAKIDGVMLRFAGSFQRDDTAKVSSVEIVQRGRIKELDGGTLKTGDNTQQKASMANTYYKVTVDGEELVEIDLINMIWKVGGVDMMEEHRKAIGL